jgi:PBSX family phage terminase large subunit
MPYNPKQKQALKKLIDGRFIYFLHYGGSRSGKTYLDVRYLVLRALKYPGTRHLLCRASKASVIESAWTTALMPLLEKEIPRRFFSIDESNKIVNFSNGSSIWTGGFDNRRHADANLGKEWATILIEEATELLYSYFNKLLTRLNWNPALSDIKVRLIAECNPPRKSHWLYRWFFNGVDFETREKLPEDRIQAMEKTHFIPKDNALNLAPEYLQTLEGLRGANRARFLDGIFYDDPTGMVYDFNRAVNVTEERIMYDETQDSWRAWDFGISPSSTFIIFLQVCPVPKSPEFPEGIKINVIDEIVNKNRDYRFYSEEVKKRFQWKRFRDAGDPAGKARNESLESWFSKLREEGINMEAPAGMSGTADYISHANRYVPYMRMNEKQTPRVVEFFENWQYPKDAAGNVMEDSKPNHDENSHGGTAFYYFTAARFPVFKPFFSQQ